ncbi:MFS transporter [Dactylosporangium sp. CA-139114]|uniref:MFS transporter n=1 Tax=Dactylosporangium sp. CA-139114 TaxID=3239931 RepID=UPI003D96410B
MAGRVISTFGNALAPIALAFAVLDITHSAAKLGLVVGARSLANVLFVLVGGVVADRLPRFAVMVLSSLVAATSQAVVATTVLSGVANMPLLISLSAINGLASALLQPASSALTSETVPRELLKQANAIKRLASQLTIILGASVGSLIVAYFGPGTALAIDAATFVLSGACFMRLGRSGQTKRPPERRSLLHDLRVGFYEFLAQNWIWIGVLVFFIFNAAWAGAIQVLGPVVADETFGRRFWGLVVAAQTAGMAVGTIVVLRLRTKHLLRVGAAAVSSACLLPFAMGLALPLGLLMAAGFAAGSGLAMFAVAWETSLQEHVAEEKLARVMSYDAAGSLVAIPVGQVTVGPAADAFGTQPVLMVAAGVMAVVIAVLLTNSTVRRLAHNG